jgi:hypothetical protein
MIDLCATNASGFLLHIPPCYIYNVPNNYKLSVLTHTANINKEGKFIEQAALINPVGNNEVELSGVYNLQDSDSEALNEYTSWLGLMYTHIRFPTTLLHYTHALHEFKSIACITHFFVKHNQNV